MEECDDASERWSSPRRFVGGVAVIRTVAPSFELGVFRALRSCEPVLTGERKLSLARQGALTNPTRSPVPTLESVGYGSYDGYAAGSILIY